MRVLIIGIDTPVGQALEYLFRQREREFVGLNRSDCRWKRQRQAKKSLRRSSCDIAIDLRIQSAVDGGAKVHEVDVARSRWLAHAANGIKIPFIHVSCARVYQGNLERPYLEEDGFDGNSSIAQFLKEAEQVVREHCERRLVLRLGPVFAPTGINVVTHMLDQLSQGQTVYLDQNHRGCPVAVEDAAWVLCALVDQLSCGVEAWGDYHYCSSDSTSCYEFAEVLLAAASQYRDISERTVQAKIDSPLRNRELDCNKIKNTFAIKQQSWRASIARHVKQIYAELEDNPRVESH